MSDRERAMQDGLNDESESDEDEEEEEATKSSTKPWHLLTHEEKIAQCQRHCKYCGKPYVDTGSLWLHENTKCSVRGASPMTDRLQQAAEQIVRKRLHDGEDPKEVLFDLLLELDEWFAEA